MYLLLFFPRAPFSFASDVSLISCLYTTRRIIITWVNQLENKKIPLLSGFSAALIVLSDDVNAQLTQIQWPVTEGQYSEGLFKEKKQFRAVTMKNEFFLLTISYFSRCSLQPL